MFDMRGVASAIRKEGSSTAKGPDGLTVLHLRHLGEHGLAFLTEVFNLSVVGVDIPTIWKNSDKIQILKAGKPQDEGRSYRPISLLCPTVKILERLLLPSIIEALGTRPFQHFFKPRCSTTSVPLPISARVVSGFNQLKPPSIAIAVDISKAFGTVSHRLLIEMIQRSRHNLVRWLTSVAGRLRAYISSTTRLPTIRGRGPHRDRSSPQPSSTTLCRTAQFPTQT